MITVKKDVSTNIRGAEHSLYISFRYNPIYVNKIKSLPNRWYNPISKEWEVPAEDLQLLLTKFNSTEIQFAQELQDNIEQLMEDREDIRERLRGITPVIDFSFKTTPYPHQIEAFNMGMSKTKLLIADEQGLGKTKESIDIAVAKKINAGVKKCLIICGVNGLKYNWEREIKIHSNELSRVIDGSSTEKRVEELKQWALDGRYFGIINIESIRKDKILDTIKRLIDSNIIGMVIVDEIHKAKNGQSQQGKALREINAPIKIGLTGTPIMNRAEDLWNLLTWLEVENRNYWRFRGRYCVLGGFNNYQVVGYKNLEELNILLNKVMLRRKKEEVLDLPDKIRMVEYVEMTGKQKQLYNQVRNALLMELDDIIISNNPLSKLIRLRQVTGGILGGQKVKIERIKELMEDEIVPNGKKAVIFSNWTEMTKELKLALEEYNPAYITGEVNMGERERQKDKFQNDDTCKVIIGTIGAMGTGLTLTAGTEVIFTDKAWTPADNDQAEDRCHRIGTINNVNVRTIVCKDTIDERIEEILTSKRDIIEQVVEGRGIERVDRRQLVNFLLDVDEDGIEIEVQQERSNTNDDIELPF